MGEMTATLAVFDAGPLITACKFEADAQLAIDHFLSVCRVVIVPSVEEEVAVLGAAYADGRAAAERIVANRIDVVAVASRQYTQHLAGYALGDGECDSIELCSQLGAQALVLDDYLAFIAAARLGLSIMI